MDITLTAKESAAYNALADEERAQFHAFIDKGMTKSQAFYEVRWLGSKR